MAKHQHQRSGNPQPNPAKYQNKHGVILCRFLLIQFRNRLEAVVYTYCISQLVTNEEKKGLEEVFKKIDTDFDGIISIE